VLRNAVRVPPESVFRSRRNQCSGASGKRTEPDDIFGKPVGAILGKYAIGTAPEGSTKLNLRLLARAVRMVLGWRLRGQTWPHPFFDRATRAPSRPLTTVSRTERDALRPLCGPHPLQDAGRTGTPPEYPTRQVVRTAKEGCPHLTA
jgi:hypothetical protein